MTSSGSSMINTNALLRAGGIGLAVSIVLALLGNGITVIATNAATASGSASGSLGALGALGLLGTCFCCLGVLAYIGDGALYGWFVRKEGGALEMGPLALGGAVTAVIVGFVTGLCNGVFSLVFHVGQFNQISSLTGGGNPGDTAAMASAGIVGAVIGVCVWVIVSAALGAIGGVIYAAIVGNQAKSAPAA